MSRPLRVILKTPMSEYSGYGQDGIGLARALMRAGVDLYLIPAHIDCPIPPDLTPLFAKRLEAPFDIFIQHQDPNFLGATPEEMASSEVTVGATMWEFTTVDNLPQVKTLRKRLETLDLVLPYDHVTAAAFAPYVTEQGRTDYGSPQLPGSPPRMRILQGGFDPVLWPKVERDWHSERFGFCMVGALHARKSPWTAIQAFSELKREHPVAFEGAELHLKDGSNTLHPGISNHYPKLRVHSGSWPMDVLHAFYAKQHVMLCPSRGEGKNMPPLEFMTTGGTAIATDWGGHVMWLDDEHSYRLKYELAPISPKLPNCQNARADVQHLKALMWHVFNNRDEVAAKAEIASRRIPAERNWDVYVAKLFGHVAELPGKGRRFRGIAERLNAKG